jgi:hypothetical protein
MFAVGGVHSDGARLRSSTPPPGWIEVVPNVVTWDDWDHFRAGWLHLGVSPLALPEQYPHIDYHISVWTIATALLLFHASLGPGLANVQLQRYFDTCSVSVNISRHSEDIPVRFFDIEYFSCIDETLMVRGDHYAGR